MVKATIKILSLLVFLLDILAHATTQAVEISLIAKKRNLKQSNYFLKKLQKYDIWVIQLIALKKLG